MSDCLVSVGFEVGLDFCCDCVVPIVVVFGEVSFDELIKDLDGLEEEEEDEEDDDDDLLSDELEDEADEELDERGDIDVELSVGTLILPLALGFIVFGVDMVLGS